MTSGLRYELLPSFLIGFHGTDQKTAKKILAGSGHLSQSQNDYDWLGHGTYFWEYSPLRAEQFIREKLNMVHELRAVTRSPDWRLAHPDTTPLPIYDTVRGAFWEGGPIYPGARIEKKNHVQICVRNSANIIAYFTPIPDD